MQKTPVPVKDHDEPDIYTIRLKGHIDIHWTDWFGNATITHEDNGETLLVFTGIDQATLFNLLRKVRDLGMFLLSVICAKHSVVNEAESKQPRRNK